MGTHKIRHGWTVAQPPPFAVIHWRGGRLVRGEFTRQIMTRLTGNQPVGESSHA